MAGSGRSGGPPPTPVEGVYAVLAEPGSPWADRPPLDHGSLGINDDDRRALEEDGWSLVQPANAERPVFKAGRLPAGVQQAFPAGVDGAGNLLLVTDRITVRLNRCVDLGPLIRRFGLHEIRLNVCCPRLVTVLLPRGLLDPFEAADTLMELPEVDLARPEILRRFGRSAAPFEPKPGDHWDEQDHWGQVDAPAAWIHTKGAGTLIAEIDNGFDLRHPELAQAAVSWSAWFPSATGDMKLGPARLPVRTHGTSCAALAAAHPQAGRNICGAAPEAGLLLVAIDAFTSAEIMGRAICYAAYPGFEAGVPDGARGADVITSSRTTPPLPPAERYPTLAAIRYARVFGRAGRGAPFVYPVSNDVPTVSDPNPVTDDWVASDPDVLSVGKISSDDVLVGHANGPGLGVVAPGYSLYTLKEGTDDYVGPGTSYAAPIAAGIAALVIAANPLIPGPYVKWILEHTCDQVGPAGTVYANGFHDWYGHGRVNALAAVTRALTLQIGT